jgi:hypothetical protein
MAPNIQSAFEALSKSIVETRKEIKERLKNAGENKNQLWFRSMMAASKEAMCYRHTVL